MLEVFLQMLTSTLNTLLAKSTLPSKKQKVAKHMLNLYQQLGNVINSYATFLDFLVSYHDDQKKSLDYEREYGRIELRRTRYDGFLPTTVIYNVTDKSITKSQVISEFSQLVRTLSEYAEYLNLVMTLQVFDEALFGELSYLYEEEGPILSAWFYLLHQDEETLQERATIQRIKEISGADTKAYFFANNIESFDALQPISLNDKKEILELCARGRKQLSAMEKCREALASFIKENFTMDELVS